MPEISWPAARQDEMFAQTQVAIEGLRSSQTDAHDAHSSNDNRRVQSPSTQVVGGTKGLSTSQTGAYTGWAKLNEATLHFCL